MAGRWQSRGFKQGFHSLNQGPAVSPPISDDCTGLTVLSVFLRALRGQAWHGVKRLP